MTTEKQLKVALYARVSTSNGRQDTQNQLQQLREFCAKQGWTIAQEYVDNSSGKRSDRPKFQQMFDGASRREFDCLLFWSLDRFSREGVLETLQHLQRLTACGVGYRSYTESLRVREQNVSKTPSIPHHPGQRESSSRRKAGDVMNTRATAFWDTGLFDVGELVSWFVS
jgi:predicted site-specific integrase-resolvase